MKGYPKFTRFFLYHWVFVLFVLYFLFKHYLCIGSLVFYTKRCWDFPLICYLCFLRPVFVTTYKIQPKIISYLPMNSFFIFRIVCLVFYCLQLGMLFYYIKWRFYPFFLVFFLMGYMIKYLILQGLIYFIFPITKQNIGDGTRSLCALCCLLVELLSCFYFLNNILFSLCQFYAFEFRSYFISSTIWDEAF